MSTGRLGLGACLAMTAFLILGNEKAKSHQENGLIEQFRRGPHLGGPETAVVGVEVVNRAANKSTQETRRGNGVLIRCDGFVLIPASLLAYRVAANGEPVVSRAYSITLNPGSPASRAIELPSPSYINPKAPFVAVKARDFHAPAIRTILPNTLKDGAVVAVVSSTFGEISGFGPVKRVPARVRIGPEQDGDLSLEGELHDAPGGAVIVDASGLAVGMLRPGTSSPRKAAGFSALYSVTNCISPLTAPPAAEGEGEPPADATPEMARVPGGPIVLPGALRAVQTDMQGASVACVAPFELDRFEVTNEDYLGFINSLPARERLSGRVFPIGWRKGDPPFPSQIARFPVVGVPLSGAQAYARWKGKRLPTPYEWCLAAYGSGGEESIPQWARDYMTQRNLAWESVLRLHLERLATIPPGDIREFSGSQAGPPQVPFVPLLYFREPDRIYRPEYLALSNWSRQTLQSAVSALFTRWAAPPYLGPVGSRDFDRSPFNIADMILNASELVVIPPWPPYNGGEWHLQVTWPRRHVTVRVPDILMLPITDNSAFQERWRPGALEPNEPPLSRILESADRSPLEALLARSSVAEAMSVLHPIVGWRLHLIPGRLTTGFTRPWGDGQSASQWWFPEEGARVWAGMPPHYRQETAWAVGDIRRARNAAAILPVGFRCAR